MRLEYIDDFEVNPYKKVYKVGIIVQCRYDSKRVPGKVFAKIGGKPSLEILLDKLLKTPYPVVVATSDRKVDNVIEEFVNKKFPKVRVCRGSFDNVLNRYDKAASNGLDYFFRITADDLFIATEYFEDALKKCINGNYDYYHTKGLIRGFDFEIIKIEALQAACEAYKSLEKIECFEHCFKNSSHYFVGEYRLPEKFLRNDISLTLDTQKDLEAIRKIYKKFNGDVTLDNIVSHANTIKNICSLPPKVSIYIINKNYTTYLNRCIKRAINQKTSLEYEIIVVDYGSTDIEKVREIVDKYPMIRYYEIQEDNFIKAMGYAISKCSANYVMRADVDDFLYEDAVDILYNEAEKGYALVIPNYDCIVAKNERVMSGAMLEKKKIEFMYFIENQSFRDGTTIIETCKKYGFKVKFLSTKLLFHTVHPQSMTKLREKEIKDHDRSVKQFIRGNP